MLLQDYILVLRRKPTATSALPFMATSIYGCTHCIALAPIPSSSPASLSLSLSSGRAHESRDRETYSLITDSLTHSRSANSSSKALAIVRPSRSTAAGGVVRLHMT